MSKYILKSFVFLVMLSMIACQPDSSEFVPNGSEMVENNNIFGLVEDQNGNAVENATIVFQGQQILTDQFGIYQFKDVDLDSRHNFVNITKEGYFEGTRTFRTNASTTVSHVTTLIEKNFQYDFSASNGGTVDEGTIQLEFDAASIVVESSGADFSGNVNVAIHYLDPLASEIIRQMPGDMSAVDADGNYSTLTSFGMAYVELQSDAGEKLQIKDGTTVKMTGKVDPDILSTAPSTIKMWYFDDAGGLWVEEGTATLEGDQYVGEVSHFSCWNYDGSAPTIIFCGRVVDQNGNPLAGVHVWVATPAFFGIGHGNTNPDGTFCGAVTKDEPLTLEVQNVDGCNTPVFIGNIGPFSTDTNFGDIVVDVDPNNLISVSGTAVDCDGNPLSNGIAFFGPVIIPITDGTFDISLPVCTANGTYNLRIVDIDNSVESVSVPFMGTGPNNAGQIDACVNEVENLQMFSDDLSLYRVGLIEAFAGTDTTGQSGKNFFGYYEGVDGPCSANFNYDDGNTAGFSTGTFALTYGNFWDSVTATGNGINYSMTSGQVTITEYNDIEKYIRGNYTCQMEDPDGVNIDLYGSFKLQAF